MVGGRVRKSGLPNPPPSGSLGLRVTITCSRPPDRLPRACPRAADPVATLSLPPPTGRSLAAPDEGRRRRVPVPRHRLEPADDLGGPLRMLAAQRPPLQDALQALGHVQPGPADRGI